MCLLWRSLALLSCLHLGALADKPALDGVVPSGAAPGTTNTITLLGKFDPWPPQLWVGDDDGLSFQFQTNKGKLDLIVSPHAQPGPRLFRLYNDDGVSEPRFLLVGSQPEVLEQEPNNHFRSPQLITNVATINGRLEKNGDVDSFSISLRAGQWLDAQLQSYTLMSKLDPVLRLLDTNGFQLAWNHDFDSLDPRLIWRSPKDQSVILQVFGFVYPANASIELSGGSGGYYRLHLASPATHPFPLPKDECDSITPGKIVSGVICPAGDLDRYTIPVKKDQWIEARVSAFAIGSPLDPWLAIEDSSGKELARNDDADNIRDSRLEWKAPADGAFTLVVGSLTRNAREDFRYQLHVQELEPACRARVTEDNFTMTAGSTNEIKVALQRLRGFTNTLTLSFPSLPEGITSTPREDTKGGEVTVSLIAATNAPPWTGPIQLLVTDNITRHQTPVAFDLISRSENNGVPGGYLKLAIETVEDLWLTIRPPTPAK